MSAKATTKTRKKRASKKVLVDDKCYIEVIELLDFRLTKTARSNISVTPRYKAKSKPVVELCGTVNFGGTRDFAEQTARLVPGISDGSHKLVNKILIVPPDATPADVVCCCPDSGCMVLQVSVCPEC